MNNLDELVIAIINATDNGKYRRAWAELENWYHRKIKLMWLWMIVIAVLSFSIGVLIV